MSLLDLKTIPGFAEAANAEETNRELAFMRSPPPVAGLPVRHYNARHHTLLVGCRCHFIVGGRITPEDVAMFLWFLSPEYVEGNARARDKFVAKRVGKLNFAAAVAAITAYLDQVLQDWPAGGARGSRDYTASVAVLVDLLASEYGWTDELILEMPLARVFQYVRRITLRHNPKAIMFNPTDRFIGNYLRERNAAPHHS